MGVIRSQLDMACVAYASMRTLIVNPTIGVPLGLGLATHTHTRTHKHTLPLHVHR